MSALPETLPMAATDTHEAPTWRRANVRLIEKTLSEFTYEGLIAPERDDADGFVLRVDGGGWRWCGRLNSWGQPLIAPGSVVALDGSPATDAIALLSTLLQSLAIEPVTLAHYLRETLNTLAADQRMLAARAPLSAGDWLDLPCTRLQQLLDGHPKAIPAKGRVGWGMDDNLRYGPEAAPAFRLHWLAVRHDLAAPICARGWDVERLLAATCDDAAQQRLHERLAGHGADRDGYWLLPVHPWQWQAMIAPKFAALLADGRLIGLGTAGDRYTPQQSLRTLSNLDRPVQPDLKLPLSILNTSCYRGLPQRHLEITPPLSDALQQLVASDPHLRDCNTQALAEPASAFVPHPNFHGLDGVPYQFDEMLGAVWRESVHARCGAGERIWMAAVLQQCDDAGRPLAAELIARSGLDARKWLTRLFDLAVVPLYHLQAHYGLGFIAHGQNLMLRLRDHAPTGIALKDYQGDLFRVDADDWPCPDALPEPLWQALPTMPPHYLVHNLWTGLFASVFRFMASALDAAGMFAEDAFYTLLAERLRRHEQAHPELADRFDRLGLFAPMMPRLSLNRARFAAGYADAASRPIHARGPDLRNPLCAPSTLETSP